MITIDLPECGRAKLDALEEAARVSAVAARDVDTVVSARQLELSAAMSAGNEQRAEKLEQDLARLQPRLVSHRETMRSTRSLLTRCKSWMAQLQLSARTDIQLVPATARAATRKGEVLELALRRVRDNIVSKQKELRAARAALLPRDELTARTRKLVNDLAASARVRVTGGTVLQPVVGVLCELASPLALVAWAVPDLLVDRIVSQFPIATDAPGDVPTLELELLALEREEEALVERAHQEGTYIVRRDDADPRAVLGVAVA